MEHPPKKKVFTNNIYISFRFFIQALKLILKSFIDEFAIEIKNILKGFIFWQVSCMTKGTMLLLL